MKFYHWLYISQTIYETQQELIMMLHLSLYGLFRILIFSVLLRL
nr:MAG TPA: hypothetical protein [Inoviridae sp.]